MSYLPSLIKSINPISITLANTVASNTATIPAVIIANSALICTGMSEDGSAGPPNDAWAIGTITNTTTITATRIATVGQVIYSAILIEFVDGYIKSSGSNKSITLADTVASNTDTISAVSIARTAVFWTGTTSTVDSGTSLTINSSQMARLTLTNTTTVTATRATSGGNAIIGYCYVEFR